MAFWKLKRPGDGEAKAISEDRLFGGHVIWKDPINQRTDGVYTWPADEPQSPEISSISFWGEAKSTTKEFCNEWRTAVNEFCNEWRTAVNDAKQKGKIDQDLDLPARLGRAIVLGALLGLLLIYLRSSL